MEAGQDVRPEAWEGVAVGDDRPKLQEGICSGWWTMKLLLARRRDAVPVRFETFGNWRVGRGGCVDVVCACACAACSAVVVVEEELRTR